MRTPVQKRSDFGRIPRTCVGATIDKYSRPEVAILQSSMFSQWVQKASCSERLTVSTRQETV